MCTFPGLAFCSARAAPALESDRMISRFVAGGSSVVSCCARAPAPAIKATAARTVSRDLAEALPVNATHLQRLFVAIACHNEIIRRFAGAYAVCDGLK